MSEIIIVKLERHKANNTPAETYWKVIDPLGFDISIAHAEEMGYIKYLYSDKVERKTHWNEYYAVFNSSIIFLRIRISNRGNFSIERFKPEQLEVTGIEKDIVLYKSPFKIKT
jgi:hypothetical protein